MVLSRKKDESIVIGGNITILVVDIGRGRVRLGIVAPRGVSVHRQEVHEAIQREKAEAEAEETRRERQQEKQGEPTDS